MFGGHPPARAEARSKGKTPSSKLTTPQMLASIRKLEANQRLQDKLQALNR